MKSNIPLASLVAALAFLLPISQSHASLLYYDGFDYTAGVTVGSASGNGPSGGSGWGSGMHWFDNSYTASNLYTVTTGGLSYNSLTTVGNALSQGTDTIGAQRSFNNTNTTIADGTYYVSFLYSVSGLGNSTTQNQYAGLQLGGGGYYVGLHTQTAGSTTRDFVLSGAYGNTNVVSTGVTITAGQTYLLVLKLDYSSTGADSASLWVNPLTADESSAGAAQATNSLVNFSNLNLANFYSSSTGYGMTTDELRIGTTWADVMPGMAVPEPRTYALFAGAMILLLMGFKRRSRCASIV